MSKTKFYTILVPNNQLSGNDGFAVAQEVFEGDVGTASKADLEKVHPTKPPYSPYAGRNFPTVPLFGDTHLHTSFSMDAGAFGARLTPARCLPVCTGRGTNLEYRPAGQAVAAA